ncbi:LacI family DNA-binding transcriptional regulator [Halomonas binhaiensis]|uniref:LacI family DNA-binding transcriptional regulator n=2 Tax=Halomonas binhaiensis TaxID=2562282 RepID=A0A5C1NL21_9GAMM|nr:LacI family DNA-binding transcriptional regulator [Halomonas binhaiensis]
MQRKRTITSRDVAERAGVSQSAVSRCFSPKASISEKTKNKVLKAAKELGYRPNSIARSLITRSSRTIALVLSHLDNMFYPLVIEKASLRFQAEDYHLLLFVVPEAGDFSGVMERILQSQVDGILMMSASLTSSLARECVDSGIPVVLVNRKVDFDGISQVYSDNYHGGFWVGSYLAMAGHDRVAYLAGLESSSTSRHRYQGLVDGLASLGKQCHAIAHGDYDFEQARAATRQLFTAPPYPDAVFAASDHMAIAVMETLRDDFNLRIPEDVSVIGFDDTPVAAWPSYRLTTVRQPVDQMVEEATTLLLRQIRQGDFRAESRILPVTPILRHSVRSPVREATLD